MNDDRPANDTPKPRTLRDAFRERLAANAAEHDESAASLARDKVAYIELQRVSDAEWAHAKELQAVKEHWENSFERFDQLERSNELETERPADDVERLREKLSERLKSALQSLSQEQSYERGYSR